MATTRTIISKANEIPKKYRTNYISSIGGTASPREAIKAFCLECMGYNAAEIKRCETIHCPLNLYRPYQYKIKQELHYD
jgi:hypothetical protein